MKRSRAISCNDTRLQARAVDDLHVDNHLAAVVVDDQDTDAAAARLKRLGQPRPEVGLVDDRQALLNVARLSHGDNGALLHVQDTVLLEDRAEHGLDNNAGSRAGDEGRLLVQLLGEEVDTEVAVLASGRRGRDADDLAGTALEHEDVTHADVVARDSNRVGHITAVRRRTAGTPGLAHLGHINLLAAAALWVHNSVSHFVESVTERVVMTVLVVVAHLGFLAGGVVTGNFNSLLGDTRLLVISGAESGNVDGRVVNVHGFLVGRRRVTSRVNGRTAYVDFLAVVGLKAGTVLVLSNVNGVTAARLVVVMVNLNMRFRVRGRSTRGSAFFAVVLLMDTGTAVMILFTSDTDLFFAITLLLTGRKFGGS